MDWKTAGRGWGARALEWAYLVEPYALPANELLFDRLGVTAGVRLLDIACGSGFAAAGVRHELVSLERLNHQLDDSAARTGCCEEAMHSPARRPCPAPQLRIATQLSKRRAADQVSRSHCQHSVMEPD